MPVRGTVEIVNRDLVECDYPNVLRNSHEAVRHEEEPAAGLERRLTVYSSKIHSTLFRRYLYRHHRGPRQLRSYPLGSVSQGSNLSGRCGGSVHTLVTVESYGLFACVAG